MVRTLKEAGELVQGVTIMKILKKGDRWGGQIVTTDWEDTFYLQDENGERIGD